jgi:hypothetical protein
MEAKNRQATTEELLGSFSMASVSYQRKVDDELFPELLVHFFILFRHQSKKYGHTTRASFLTCFGSLSHHQSATIPTVGSFYILEYWFM